MKTLFKAVVITLLIGAICLLCSAALVALTQGAQDFHASNIKAVTSIQDASAYRSAARGLFPVRALARAVNQSGGARFVPSAVFVVLGESNRGFALSPHAAARLSNFNAPVSARA